MAAQVEEEANTQEQQVRDIEPCVEEWKYNNENWKFVRSVNSIKEYRAELTSASALDSKEQLLSIQWLGFTELARIIAEGSHMAGIEHDVLAARCNAFMETARDAGDEPRCAANTLAGAAALLRKDPGYAEEFLLQAIGDDPVSPPVSPLLLLAAAYSDTAADNAPILAQQVIDRLEDLSSKEELLADGTMNPCIACWAAAKIGRIDNAAAEQILLLLADLFPKDNYIKLSLAVVQGATAAVTEAITATVSAQDLNAVTDFLVKQKLPTSIAQWNKFQSNDVQFRALLDRCGATPVLTHLASVVHLMQPNTSLAAAVPEQFQPLMAWFLRSVSSWSALEMWEHVYSNQTSLNTAFHYATLLAECNMWKQASDVLLKYTGEFLPDPDPVSAEKHAQAFTAATVADHAKYCLFRLHAEVFEKIDDKLSQEEMLAACAEIDPSDGQSVLTLADILSDSKRTKEAIHVLDSIIASQANVMDQKYMAQLIVGRASLIPRRAARIQYLNSFLPESTTIRNPIVDAVNAECHKIANQSLPYRVKTGISWFLRSIPQQGAAFKVTAVVAVLVTISAFKDEIPRMTKSKWQRRSWFGGSGFK
eukprot:TRINITY_DN35124_c0_g1_i1.p1 TRINITY_DN35124_c0_g1~~TRINITY_DN35124_c0_g1_i1.p1  ORF type:complete len:593 (+),score=49.13 TRINITY_DN35124_c0_g1_i1:24-1802(+)